MRLVRGAPGSGKTALVFREFAEALRAGRANLRIVVPTATLVRHYQHELARSGLVFDPSLVMSLSRFARDCVPDLRLIDAGLLRALVSDTLARLSLPEFAEVATTQGMTDVVVDTITRFENAGCSPARLSRFRNLSAHGKAFLRVWKEVEAAVAARGFVTRGTLFRRAAACVPPLTVWIDAFGKFSPLETELLRSVAANCDLVLTLATGPATDEAHRLVLELGASDRLLTNSARRPQTIAVTAPAPEREADEIARRILELRTSDRETEFSDIAVALRDVDEWLPLLRTTFDRFGIPARYYFSTPAETHPVALFLGGLITCALADFDFAQTVAVLRAHPAWGHSADFDRFDFRIREAMPGRGAEAFLNHCDSPRLRADMAECLKVGAWREVRVAPAIWQRRFGQLAESLYRIPTVQVPLDYAAVEAARSHAAGLRAWSGAVERAVEFLGTGAEAISLERFHGAVMEALHSATMEIPNHRRNVVHVMSAFEARQWQVRALFVCGMTARDYPRRAAQNLLFPDSDLEGLRRAGIPVRTSADEDRDEELLFDSLQTRASESVILTVSARDAGGKTILPSRHFSASARAVPCRAGMAKGAVASVELVRPGHISRASLAGLASRHATIRLTSLEDLAKCRFRFFAGRTLTLEGVPERPEKRLTPSALGLIVHEAMEAWLAERTRDFVSLFESTFDDFCRKRNIQAGYRLEVERVGLRRVAHKVNESVRWPVVSSESEAECSIDFPGGITVTGRVDRIDDIGDGDCIILDYKSGKVNNVKKLAQRETSLQAPLYALAVREKKGLNPVVMVFLAVRENKMFVVRTSRDFIDSARDRTVVRLDSFLAGDVHAGPNHPDDCIWCDFKNVCRVETLAGDAAELVRIGVAGAN